MAIAGNTAPGIILAVRDGILREYGRMNYPCSIMVDNPKDALRKLLDNQTVHFRLIGDNMVEIRNLCRVSGVEAAQWG